MRKLLIGCVLLAVSPLFWQQVRGQSPSIVSGKNTSNSTSQPTTDQRGTKDSPLVVDTQGHKETSAEAEEKAKEKEDKYSVDTWTLRWAAITASATVILMFVGIGGVVYARKTLKVIGGQLTEIRSSGTQMDTMLNHAGIQAEALKKQTDLMGQQWVDYGQWEHECFADEGGKPKIRIGFVVVNRTPYPLSLPTASIKFSTSLGRNSHSVCLFRFRRDCRLLPNKGPVDYVELEILKSDWQFWESGDAPIKVLVEGDLSFVGAGSSSLQEQTFYGTLFCTKGKTRFEEETRHQEQCPT